MEAKDLIIGGKYVAHKKTIGIPFENSYLFGRNFIYYTGVNVNGMHCFNDYKLSCPEIDEEYLGEYSRDFFDPSDVTPYIGDNDDYSIF